MLSKVKSSLWSSHSAISLLFTIILQAAFPFLANAQDQGDAAWIDTLQTARVTATKEKLRNTTQTGLMRIDAKKLKAGYAVFGTPDVIKTLQLMPGVASGNELMSGLYVHGGDGNDNLFLLDGVPLYNISHFGGMFSSFNTDVVDNLDFYKSGFPSRFGGKLSSVVDVETREGDMKKWHGSVSIGIIDGRIQFEGPIVEGKTSLNFGIRRTWLDLVTRPAIAIAKKKKLDEGQDVDGFSFMQDINLGITHIFSERSKLNLRAFNGKDDMGFDLYQKEDDLTLGLDMGIEWGSSTLSAAWDYKLTSDIDSKLLAYWSRSKSDMGYNILIDTGEDGKMTLDDKNVSLVRDLGLNWDLKWTPDDNHRIRFGTSIQSHKYLSSRGFTLYMNMGGVETNDGNGIMFPEEQSHPGVETALYAEDEWFLAHNFTLSSGLRWSTFYTDRFFQSLEPRAAIKWLLHKNYSLKASYTRMAQYVHLVSAVYMDLPSNCWMPSMGNAAPMYSDQIAGGIYTTPLPDFTLNIEGWYKKMDNLLSYNGANLFFPPLTDWDKTFASGEGKSYGLELEASWETEKASFSTYYTLSHNLRRFEDFYADWFEDRNDNRHKLNLVVSWNITDKLDFFANWNYHSGNRVTFPSHIIPEEDYWNKYLYEKPYNTKLPDYHRLDIGFNFKKTTRRGLESITNLSIYNVYNKANAMIAMLDKDGDTYRGMAYGLVPIIPTLSFTLKF